MALPLLIDTCVLIDYLRGDPRALSFLAPIEGRPFASTMTVTELYVGAGRAGEEERIADLLDRFAILDIDIEIARQGGRFRRRYGPSHGVGIIDALIAATAHVHHLRLVTRNARHFPMLAGLLVPYP